MKTPPDSHDHSGCDHDHDHDHAKCGHDHGPKHEHTHEHGSGCCGHDHGHGEHHHHHHHGKEGEAGHEHSHDHGHSHHTHSPAEVAAEEKEWTRRFFLFLEFAVLMVWAVVMIWFYASGRVEKYLVGEGLFRIQVLAAGLALFVMGLFNWLMRAQNAGCGHDHSADGDDCRGHDHDHDHAHGPGCGHSHDTPEEEPHTHHHHEGSVSGRGVSLVLLTLSVTAAAAMTADDFSDSYKKSMVHADAGRPAEKGTAPEQYKIAPDSATAAAAPGGPKAGVTLELIEKYQKRNAAGNFELDVMQLYYSGSDPEYAAVMKGQGVETVGQVVKDPSSPDANRYRVFVLQVSCCAADARPFSLPVELTGPHGEIQEMGWYKLAGKIDYIEERGVTTAILRASDVQATVRAKDPRALF